MDYTCLLRLIRCCSDIEDDLDTLDFDNDKDTIATFNTLMITLDTDVFPVWQSIINKAKSLERVLGYPASTVSLVFLMDAQLR